MTQVSIIGLERTLFDERSPTGYLFLAYFAAKVGPITLKGCALVHFADGRTDVWMPNLSDKKARKYRSVDIHDREVRSALRREAVGAFERMGGEVPGPIAADPREDELAKMSAPPVRRIIPVTVRRAGEPDEDTNTEGVERFLGATG